MPGKNSNPSKSASSKQNSKPVPSPRPDPIRSQREGLRAAFQFYWSEAELKTLQFIRILSHNDRARAVLNVAEGAEPHVMLSAITEFVLDKRLQPDFFDVGIDGCDHACLVEREPQVEPKATPVRAMVAGSDKPTPSPRRRQPSLAAPPFVGDVRIAFAYPVHFILRNVTDAGARHTMALFGGAVSSNDFRADLSAVNWRRPKTSKKSKILGPILSRGSETKPATWDKITFSKDVADVLTSHGVVVSSGWVYAAARHLIEQSMNVVALPDMVGRLLGLMRFHCVDVEDNLVVFHASWNHSARRAQSFLKFSGTLAETNDAVPDGFHDKLHNARHSFMDVMLHDVYLEAASSIGPAAVSKKVNPDGARAGDTLAVSVCDATVAELYQGIAWHEVSMQPFLDRLCRDLSRGGIKYSSYRVVQHWRTLDNYILTGSKDDDATCGLFGVVCIAASEPAPGSVSLRANDAFFSRCPETATRICHPVYLHLNDGEQSDIDVFAEGTRKLNSEMLSLLTTHADEVKAGAKVYTLLNPYWRSTVEESLLPEGLRARKHSARDDRGEEVAVETANASGGSSIESTVLPFTTPESSSVALPDTDRDRPVSSEGELSRSIVAARLEKAEQWKAVKDMKADADRLKAMLDESAQKDRDDAAEVAAGKAKAAADKTAVTCSVCRTPFVKGSSELVLEGGSTADGRYGAGSYRNVCSCCFTAAMLEQ